MTDFNDGTTGTFHWFDSAQKKDKPKNYTISAKVSSSDNDSIGVMFRYQDSENYYRLLLNSQNSYRRLDKTEGGVTTTMVEDVFAYAINEEYEIEVSANGDYLSVKVNGVSTLEVVDDTFVDGAVALYSAGNSGSYFDDLIITDIDSGNNIYEQAFGSSSVRSHFNSVDEGDTSFPSAWSISSGKFVQSSNIYQSSDWPRARGTYAIVKSTMNPNWAVDTERTANNSTYSLRSGSITTSQTSSIETHINSYGGLLSFDVSVSSEGCCDKVRLYVDGVEEGVWSGEAGFVHAAFYLDAGQHTLKWQYKKDGSGDIGSDSGWIDNLFLPSVSDTDEDGAADALEYEHFNTLDQDLNGDSDNDGLTELQEAELGSNPNSADTDGDGIDDLWEVNNGTNILVDDGALDLDGDGQNNYIEYVLTTASHPVDQDRDGDRIPDIFEANNGLNPLDASDAALDGDNDGFTALEEYIAQSDYQDVNSIPAGTMTDFNDGTRGTFHWFERDHAGWTLDTERTASSSAYSLRSGSITRSQTSAIETHINSYGGLLSFDVSVSSEGCCDKVRLYVDGVEKGIWSGEAGFVQAAFYLDAGKHTLKWQYKKDGSGDTGSDSGWIDNLFLPSSADTDEDSIADAWEYDNFGTLGHDMTLDSNNDGQTDLEDWLAASVQ